MAAPLFILSFRQRDELTRTAEGAGWQPIAARRADQAEARFLASGALVALVDARGASADGVAAVRALGDAVEANAGALLVLLSRTDEGLLGELHALGATHFLVSPFTEAQLRMRLRFAARTRSGWRRAAERPAKRGRVVSWRWRRATGGSRWRPRSRARPGCDRRDAPWPAGGAAAARRGGRIACAPRWRGCSDGEATPSPIPIPSGRRGGSPTICGSSDGAWSPHRGDRARSRADSRDALTGVGDGRAARAWMNERLAERGAGDGASSCCWSR
jgi:hypothetical protein